MRGEGGWERNIEQYLNHKNERGFLDISICYKLQLIQVFVETILRPDQIKMPLAHTIVSIYIYIKECHYCIKKSLDASGSKLNHHQDIITCFAARKAALDSRLIAANCPP